MLTLSFASTSAPFASSALTTSVWPFLEAAWSGVSPSCGAGEHRGQRLPPHAHTNTLAESRLHDECMHFLSRFRYARTDSHIHRDSRSVAPMHAARTHKYTDTRMHARTHVQIHAPPLLLSPRP
jgi:hypothetical protein